jgi:hypothetical protein
VFHASLDVVLSRIRVVVPDHVAVRADRLEIIQPRGIFGAPDLVCEILSPSNRHYDQNRKRRLYASAGIPEYWILDPDANTLDQLVLGERSYALDGVHEPGDWLRSAVFDFELDVAELFAAASSERPSYASKVRLVGGGPDVLESAPLVLRHAPRIKLCRDVRSRCCFERGRRVAQP